MANVLCNSGWGAALKIHQQAISDAERYDDKYLIRPSDDTLSVEDIALGYKQLIDGKCFSRAKVHADVTTDVSSTRRKNLTF